MAKTSPDIAVGVVRKMRDYYVTDKYLGGLIKVHRIISTEKIGEEVQIYYEKLNYQDEVFVNGVKYVPNTNNTKER
jgi:hypothetical protein